MWWWCFSKSKIKVLIIVAFRIFLGWLWLNVCIWKLVIKLLLDNFITCKRMKWVLIKLLLMIMDDKSWQYLNHILIRWFSLYYNNYMHLIKNFWIHFNFFRVLTFTSNALTKLNFLIYDPGWQNIKCKKMACCIFSRRVFRYRQDS